MTFAALAAAGCALAVAVCAARSEAQECRLALVLALDVSSSVDPSEYDLQRRGLAEALTDPEVVRQFINGGPVAIYAFEWAGPSVQAPMLPGWPSGRP